MRSHSVGKGVAVLVITFGTPASGSTWIYNAVRDILIRSGIHVAHVSEEGGVDMLDNLPLDACDVLLKCHAMDQRLIRIANIAGAKIIVSRRDARDSIVSQSERFGLSPAIAAIDLSRSLTTLAMIPDHLSRLDMDYEDRFMDRPETIDMLAEFLGVEISPADRAEIFEDLLPEVVRAKIAARMAAASPGTGVTHDPVTHWHPDHIGDGRIGKWRERLSVDVQNSLTRCFTPLSAGEWMCEPTFWAAELFRYQGGRAPSSDRLIRCSGERTVLAYGPYLYLPAGRWTVRPHLRRAALSRKIGAAVDVHLPGGGRGVVAACEVDMLLDPEQLVMHFEHDDHFLPIEVRVSSIADQRGDLSFAGVELRYAGPL
jgi:hypothetical protein